MKTTLFLLFSAILGALAFYMAPRKLQVRSFFTEEISSAPTVSYALLIKDGEKGDEYSVEKCDIVLKDESDIAEVSFFLKKKDDPTRFTHLNLKVKKEYWKIFLPVKTVITKKTPNGKITIECFDEKGRRVYPPSEGNIVFEKGHSAFLFLIQYRHEKGIWHSSGTRLAFI